MISGHSFAARAHMHFCCETIFIVKTLQINMTRQIKRQPKEFIMSSSCHIKRLQQKKEWKAIFFVRKRFLSRWRSSWKLKLNVKWKIIFLTVKNNTSLSCLPEVWILHHSPLEVFIPVRKHDIVSELKDGVCSFISTITHHLRMELAGTYISEGFGVIWDWDSAKEEVKLYKLSSIFCVNCGMKQLSSWAVKTRSASATLQTSAAARFNHVWRSSKPHDHITFVVHWSSLQNVFSTTDINMQWRKRFV